jgi:hypothetical protein
MSVALCVIMKEEEPYIDEYLLYYLYGLNVDKIYIYDNSDEHGLAKYNGKYKGRVDVKHMPGKAQKFNAYNDFLKRMKEAPADSRPKWFATFDTDEFLVLPTYTDIHPFLEAECKEGGIEVWWYIFGSNGHTHFSSEPVTKRFTKRGAKHHHLQKTIAVLEDVESITNPHQYNYKNGKTGRPISDTVARLNHYFGKSVEEYKRKQAKGRDDIADLKRPDSDFDAHDINEVTDTSAAKVYERALNAAGAQKGGRFRQRQRHRKSRATRRRSSRRNA